MICRNVRLLKDYNLTVSNYDFKKQESRIEIEYDIYRTQCNILVHKDIKREWIT